MLDAPVLAALQRGDYAFIDAGCASGESIDHCQRRFGLGRGLGLDWYGADLSIARSRGLDAAHCDLVRADLPAGCVTFASMVDFLEHLPDLETASRVVEKLGRAARGFLFIRHPSFDDREYLASRGLRMTWTEWSAHPNRMRVADFRKVFAAAGWRDFVVIPDAPMLDSSHPAIVPLSAPADTEEYDPAIHDPKPYDAFDRVVYGKYDIFVRLPGISDADWERAASIEGWRAIWDSPSAKRMTREGGALHFAMDSLMRAYASAGEHADEATRERVRAVVTAKVSARPRRAIHLVHLLDALGRTAGVQRILLTGVEADAMADVLRARFPAMTVDRIAGAERYDLVCAIDADDEVARAASGNVRSGGWFYEAGFGRRADGDRAPLGARAIVEPIEALLRDLGSGATGAVLPGAIALARLDLERHRHQRLGDTLGGKALRQC